MTDYKWMNSTFNLSLSLSPLPYLQTNLYCTLNDQKKKKIKKWKEERKRENGTEDNHIWVNLIHYKPNSLISAAWREARVFIGFSFKPMLSGERSSGEMQDGLSGLLGLSLSWLGRYKPYPIRKNSIGINIACGCSSVTIDPHDCTCRKRPKSSLDHTT